MNILLIGSGGREHAFARSLSASPMCNKLLIAPGNPGTALCGTNVQVLPNDFTAIKKIVLQEKIELVIVGPEDPLVNGIVDFFLADAEIKNISVIGPDAAGAKLEGSKAFSKGFMHKYNIPTAAYQHFSNGESDKAGKFLETINAPYVLKADGLAAGKGVIITSDLDEAKTEVKSMLSDGKFGKAGETVVIEEFLKGIEVSVFVLTDGKNYKVLPEAKDYKRIGEGDTGLNTGGMGAVSPVTFFDDALLKKTEEKIIKPTIEGLKKEGIKYKGFIFLGLMCDKGEPSVIEYNCRMGDPETEAVLPRIKTDFVALMKAVAEENLDSIHLETDHRTAATVVMVSGGYPGNFEKGFAIEGLDQQSETLIFHSGTEKKENVVVTSGGRVLALTSLADNLESALVKSFATAEKIQYKNSYYRKDIGKDILKLI